MQHNDSSQESNGCDPWLVDNKHSPVHHISGVEASDDIMSSFNLHQPQLQINATSKSTGVIKRIMPDQIIDSYI
jgi:hypothetical protein